MSTAEVRAAYRAYENAYVAYLANPGTGTHYRFRQAQLHYRAAFELAQNALRS